MIRPASSTSLRARIADWVLSTEAGRRLPIINGGLALMLMLLSVAIMYYAVWEGFAQSGPIAWWTAFTLGGAIPGYALIRSGVSRRFVDPSLTLPQMVHSIACCALGYALSGPMRGAVFPILMIVVMFGMFQLRATQAFGVSLFALLLFGVAMAVMIRLDPQVYVPAIEVGHYLMLMAMLPAVSLLVGRLARIRQRLAAQKRELAHALDKLQAMAMRDDLTGLLNRRHMQALLEQEVQRCQRSGSSFCVALLDIDHFKRINDQHGHAAGDEVLRAFAQQSVGAIRNSDLLARWGGEEFVVMLPDTHMPPAVAGIERLREQVQALKVVVGATELGVTVSAGLTQHKADETLTQTLERADRLLYEAKHQGRDRVVVG